MKTRASKQEAVSLIRHAVACGFKREVSALRDSQNQPYCVTVSLKGEFKTGGLWTWSYVHVSFRIARKSWSKARNSIVMSSRSDYNNSSDTGHGLRNARYAVNYVVETARRFGAVPQGW